MANLQQYFLDFISNIEPSKEHKDNAKDAHTNLLCHLENDSVLSANIDEKFLYGSYSRNTAIHTINDVDICIVTNFDHTSEDFTPKKVLRKVKSTISNYYTSVLGYDEVDGKATKYNRRSIQVLNPLPDKLDSELTLDVIPAIKQDNSDNLLVPDRSLGSWIETNVKGHETASTNKNKAEDGKFIPFVKIMKHWKKIHLEKHPKGFWLESLLLDHFEYSNSYAESFDTTLESIIDKFPDHESLSEVPTISDPGMEGETIRTNMSLKDFISFMDQVVAHKEKSAEALVSDDKNARIIWQDVFGIDYFKLSSYSDLKIRSLSVRQVTDDEEYITNQFGYRLNNSIKISIKCYKMAHEGKSLSNPYWYYKNIKVQRNQFIKFDIDTTNLPNNAIIYWKVKNNGAEIPTNEHRGNIVKNQTIYNVPVDKINVEHTMYVGEHTVECYAIYNRIVVAADRFIVKII